MEEIVNGSILGDGISNITFTTESEERDFRTLAMSYLMYKIGKPFHSKSELPEAFVKKQRVHSYFAAYFYRNCDR